MGALINAHGCSNESLHSLHAVYFHVCLLSDYSNCSFACLFLPAAGLDCLHGVLEIYPATCTHSVEFLDS